MAHYDDVRDSEQRPAKPKNKGGRPKKPIDYEKLKKMCAIHCTGDECAALLDVSYEHLNNSLIADGHGGFLDFFKKHSAGGKMSLRRKQFEKAHEGSIPMLIWLGKQYLGQSDKIIDESADDKPIEVRIIDAAGEQ